MMHALTLVHRWLGIPLCLLFAMWFASGIVMHFVPFPALTEAERIAGLAPVDLSRVLRGPGEAATASGIKDAARVRLLERSDGPVYLVSGTAGTAALHADDLSSARVASERLALAIATDHARRRGLDVTHAMLAELAASDQWTVPNDLDPHRPLYRIALNDGPGTELYVSSTTGEILRDTTRRERWWNYAGSVAHWIYPTVLRGKPQAWNATVWWLSLAALIATICGILLGTLRIEWAHRRLVSPYRGWHAWHHVLGLACMTFVLTWIFSGWLSMDSGRLFSTGKLTDAEAMRVPGAPAWDSLSTGEPQRISAQAREIEWFSFNAKFYRRERIGLDLQRLFAGDLGAAGPAPRREHLDPGEISALVEHLAPGCEIAAVVKASDAYAIAATMPHAPVYRSVCGDVWFHIDGASGAILERLDSSRRAYRWLYGALHTFDIPVLVARPGLRTALIVVLCGCGLGFSLTGIVISWRRMRSWFRQAASQG
jgi:hypothetical protein